MRTYEVPRLKNLQKALERASFALPESHEFCYCVGMKKMVLAAVIFLLVPSVSFAAALTTEQANSLIAVVQSSPGTPASAFTNLITAFSNITVAQADSLIGVVQAAPGAPGGAFVNLLTSFTVDAATRSTTQANQQIAQSSYVNSCNGSQYPACLSNSHFVCPNTGSGYCIQDTTTYAAPVAITPQPIEQQWMNKFLSDAATAINTLQNNANSAVSSASNAADCSSSSAFSGWISSVCTYASEGVTDIANLQTWASSVKNPYRSTICDHQIFYPLDQAVSVEEAGVEQMMAEVHTPGTLGIMTARINQTAQSTNAQVSAFSAQAQAAAASCQ